MVLDERRVAYEGIEMIRIDREDGSYDVQCGLCDLIVKNENRKSRATPYRLLVNHIKGNHLGGYNCEFCDTNFRDPVLLKRHKNNKHTERPKDKYTCDICGRPFHYAKVSATCVALRS